MADQIQYKCPNCGGSIEFSSSLQKMECPYCGSEFDVQAVAALDEQLRSAEPDRMDWAEPEGEWSEDEADGLVVLSCKSCGGEIVAERTAGAMTCPYCDSPVVRTGAFSGDLRPRYVIPFKLDKAAAKEALKGHLATKKLLPKVFKDENHIDEIKGIYVPFWIFDADISATMRFRATTSMQWRDSKFIYTKTSHYSVVRSGEIAFDRVPADGSSKIDDTLMEAIEPFDFSQAVDFQTAYLSGYLADRYDVPSDERFTRVNERMRVSAESAFASTVSGYMSVTPEASSIQLKSGRVEYILLPVWFLNTTWKGTRYTFAMNAQTGKFVGDLPSDFGATAVMFGTTAIAAAAVFMGIAYLIWLLAGFNIGDIAGGFLG